MARVPVTATDIADPAKRDDWFERRNMLVFQLVDPDDPFCGIDVFIRNSIDFDDPWSRALVETLGGSVVRLVAVNDLIAMKELAGRPEDLRDIAALTELTNASGRRGRH